MIQSIAKPLTGVFVIVLLAWTLNAHAQQWPSHPMTFVVGFAPGSISDILARLIGQKLGESLGQTVIVDNRPGAGGNIATQRVRVAAADGYMLLVTSSAYAVNPSLYANAGYDPLKDFTPVILAASTPNLITVHPSVPAKTLQELIELARKQPLAYASTGIGTTPHLSMERLKTTAKIEITHVPFQPAQAVTSVLTGQTQVASTAVTLPLPHIKTGKLRPIAVMGAQRSSVLADVPTVNEQGFQDFNDLTWFGFFAPAAIRAELVGRLNAEINRIIEQPEIREKLAQLGLDSRRNTATEFAAFIKEEVPKWAQAVKVSGAKVD